MRLLHLLIPMVCLFSGGLLPAESFTVKSPSGNVAVEVIMVPDLVQPTQEIRELTYRVCDSLADVIGILN